MTAALDRLSRLDACAVSDALDALGLAPSVTGLSPLSVAAKICGRVVTVRLVAGTAPAGTPPRHLCTQAIDQATPGDVIVVEHRSGVVCAGWGGILSRAARHKGLGGTIIDGLARDLDEARSIGFPVYARGATARTARGRIHEVATGAPIVVGDVSVRTGDYVIADSSGVAFIAADRVETVLTAAERISAKEAAMAEAVEHGEPASIVMGASYEHLLER